MFTGQARRAEPTRPATPRAVLQPARAWERVIVLANRAPVRHERDAHGRPLARRSASGLVTALEPAIRACSGTWVAHADGSADRVMGEARNGVMVPSGAHQYRIRYVTLPSQEHQGYYYGFANEALWPLCHDVGVPPVFRRGDFEMYSNANLRFAEAVREESAGKSALVLVQDYHFALAPRLVRERQALSTVVTFWHIPWPRPAVMRACPWMRELLDGLLGSDIVGLQTAEDCTHFLRSAESLLDAETNEADGVVTYRGRSTKVRPYPVGVEWCNEAVRTAAAPSVCRERVYRRLQIPASARLGIGVDRLDYTKGINEKLLAVERLLERRPDLRGSFVFVQMAEPSRECLPAYRAVRAQILDTTTRINARFETGDCRPIQLLEAHHEPTEVYELYRAADFCYVASLADGMNLVAKEFVCARDDRRGVLVLSRYAGAARQLGAALIVDPLMVDQAAGALANALDMSEPEQAGRMDSLRSIVSAFDSTWWIREILADAASIEQPVLHRRGAKQGQALAAPSWLPYGQDGARGDQLLA